MTKNRVRFDFIALITILIFLLTPHLFADVTAAEKKALAAAKAEADAILNDTNVARAQLKLCNLAESIFDVSESIGNKKVGVQTDVQYATIKKHQPALQTIEAFQAQIEAQKLASSAFKSKYSNECIGKNKEPFEISFTVDKFRAIYERFSKAPPPKPRPTTRGAGGTFANGSRASTSSEGSSLPGNTGLINSSCDTKDMKAVAVKTFAILYDETAKKSTRVNTAPTQMGIEGSCNYFFDLRRVGDKIFVLDRQSQRKQPTPSGEQVASSAELFDVLRRSRSPAPANQPAPAVQPSPTQPAPVKRNSKS